MLPGFLWLDSLLNKMVAHSFTAFCRCFGYFEQNFEFGRQCYL
uniref:Uncharacterized protein n=1 Tax=Rhizophora mucronata TaxID=61149 RepID=A0A2P2R1D2_RHIMU